MKYIVKVVDKGYVSYIERIGNVSEFIYTDNIDDAKRLSSLSSVRQWIRKIESEGFTAIRLAVAE